jgi:hypothetical protein
MKKAIAAIFFVMTISNASAEKRGKYIDKIARGGKIKI